MYFSRLRHICPLLSVFYACWIAHRGMIVWLSKLLTWFSTPFSAERKSTSTYFPLTFKSHGFKQFSDYDTSFLNLCGREYKNLHLMKRFLENEIVFLFMNSVNPTWKISFSISRKSQNACKMENVERNSNYALKEKFQIPDINICVGIKKYIFQIYI